MDKPISVAIRYTRDKLLDVLNSSGIPIDILDMMLMQIQTAVHAQAEQAYLQDKAQMEKGVEDGTE